MPQVEQLFGEIEDVQQQDMPAIDENDKQLKMPGLDIAVRQWCNDNILIAHQLADG